MQYQRTMPSMDLLGLCHLEEFERSTALQALNLGVPGVSITALALLPSRLRRR